MDWAVATSQPRVRVASEAIVSRLSERGTRFMPGAYYIYALKDPRQNPAKPFYIGKGTGMRMHDHLARVDKTAKGKRISEIRDQGFEPVVTEMVSDLDELTAIRLEAEFISSFGLEGSGGLLTNSVVPTGTAQVKDTGAVVPHGAVEKAQLGLKLLKDAVLEMAKANPMGVRNADVCKSLGLQSDYMGGSKDYLSWSVIGLLIRDGKLRRDDGLGKARHAATVE